MLLLHAAENYESNKKYALNNGLHLTTSIYGNVYKQVWNQPKTKHTVKYIKIHYEKI